MNKLGRYFSACFQGAATAQNELEFSLHIGESEEVIRTWLRRVKDINEVLPISKITPLQLAIEQKNASAVEAVLCEGADTERTSNLERTPILTASASGFLEGVKLLINHNADIGVSSPNGSTCLILAAKRKHLSVVSYLLDQKSCPINGADRKGFTALHYIVLLNDSSLTSKLICQGSDINAQTSTGEAPVFLAAKNSCLESLTVLLEAGADPNLCTKASHCHLEGESTLNRAMSYCDNDAVQLLLTYGADTACIGKDGFTALGCAIWNQDFPMMTLLLDQGADTEQICDFQWTPLLKACVSGYLEGVKLLVERGADITVQTSDKLTCLIVALKNRHHSVVSYLLEQENCPINATEANGLSALHYVVPLNDPNTTNVLISKGADIDALSKDGETPVFVATKRNCMESLKVLLEAGADPNMCIKGCVDQYENCAFWSALGQRNFEALHLLLSHGADITTPREDGSSALDLAIMTEDISLMKLLMDQGFNIEHKCSRGWTPLMTACSRGFSKGVALLIKRGADINAQNEDGETAVSLAAKLNRIKCLKVLLEADADPNVMCKNGESALRQAVRQGSLDAVRTLLNHGADKTEVGKDGLTLLSLALAVVPFQRDLINYLSPANMEDENTEELGMRVEKAEQNLQRLQVDVEQCIYCPITFEVMQDPVLAADGHTYERKAIEQWLCQSKESPVTRKPISSDVLIPNLAIKHLINRNSNTSEES
eukprot:g6626.t1